MTKTLKYLFLENFSIALLIIFGPKSCQTRLHSSRMRTACALTVSPSMLCARGVCLVRGGAWSGGMPGLGGGILACTEADLPCEQNDKQV